MADESSRPSLTPLDEAYVAHADALSALAHDILQDFPLKPRAAGETGTFLREALHLRYLADRIVEAAVIVERERQASWADIGTAAGITKQTAHERWGTLVGGWTLMHRQHTSRFGTAHRARSLDTWYAEFYPDEEFAVTAGLAAVDPRNVVEQDSAAAERAEAKAIKARIEELRHEGDEAYNATFSVLLDDRQGRTAALQRWAGTHTARAEAYDRLALIEPTVADDHHARAAKQRELAARIQAGADSPTTPAPAQAAPGPAEPLAPAAAPRRRATAKKTTPTLPKPLRLTRKKALALLDTAELVKAPHYEDTGTWDLVAADGTFICHLAPNYTSLRRNGWNVWPHGSTPDRRTHYPNRDTAKAAGAGAWLRIVTAKPAR